MVEMGYFPPRNVALCLPARLGVNVRVGSLYVTCWWLDLTSDELCIFFFFSNNLPGGFCWPRRAWFCGKYGNFSDSQDLFLCISVRVVVVQFVWDLQSLVVGSLTCWVGPV